MKLSSAVLIFYCSNSSLLIQEKILLKFFLKNEILYLAFKLQSSYEIQGFISLVNFIFLFFHLVQSFCKNVCGGELGTLIFNVFFSVKS